MRSSVLLCAAANERDRSRAHPVARSLVCMTGVVPVLRTSGKRELSEKKKRREIPGAVSEMVRFRPVQADQYSRSFFRPGIGTGYLPSLSESTGGGESIVHLSMPGAYSWG